jgi:hypothetical protein
MESIKGDTPTQVWLARHNLGVVDYKALTRLSLLWVPHFRARHGASLKDLNPGSIVIPVFYAKTKYSSYA